jgi:antitoxin component HigA of HigAB toxin-antitoxin module
MIAVSGKYALEVGSPTPIASERQYTEYISVLDKLASKAHSTREEEKYAEVLMTLIEAYEEEHHPSPDASPVEVLRSLIEANDLRQKTWSQSLALKVSCPKFCTGSATSTRLILRT